MGLPSQPSLLNVRIQLLQVIGGNTQCRPSVAPVEALDWLL